jgi:hypothetical protein
MKVAPLRRQPLPAPRARTRTHAHSAHFWKALYICAHTHSYIYLHCYIHRYVPSETHLVLARSHSRRRPRARAHRTAVRGGGALTGPSGSASRPPPAAPRARCCPRTCAPKCGRPSGFGPSLKHAHGGVAGGGTHRVANSLHWPSDSGSAFTFVREMDLRCTARACGRACRAQCTDMGSNRRIHRK